MRNFLEEFKAFAMRGNVIDLAIGIIIGAAFGQESPVTQYLPTLYLECRMPAGATLDLPDEYEELGFYAVDGQVCVGDNRIGPGTMAVAAAGQGLRLAAERASHVMVVGGAALERRHIWWNFVASSRELIEQAKDDWRENRFDPVPGETDFIPLPD